MKIDGESRRAIRHRRTIAAGAALAFVLLAAAPVLFGQAGGNEHWVGTWYASAVSRTDQPPVQNAQPGQALQPAQLAQVIQPASSQVVLPPLPPAAK